MILPVTADEGGFGRMGRQAMAHIGHAEHGNGISHENERGGVFTDRGQVGEGGDGAYQVTVADKGVGELTEGVPQNERYTDFVAIEEDDLAFAIVRRRQYCFGFGLFVGHGAMLRLILLIAGLATSFYVLFYYWD